MKALIIEDEKAAVRNLKALLKEVSPSTEVIDVIDSVRDAVAWFGTHQRPDLVFLDIHLADGSSFEIFDHVRIPAPVIFTTAYDEYALKAFKVNSIDYLLKPIGAADLRQALAKFEELHKASDPGESLASLVRSMQRHERFKTHFLIPYKGDKLIPLAVSQVQYFCIADGTTRAVISASESYVLPHTLDELAERIDPDQFFRANRQYLISRHAVRDIDLWFNNRLSINLRVPTEGKILVSKLRVNDFKTWFAGYK
ncbi:LytTR family DNA-binding domain-containing protein [Alistipes sp.]|uniref:LytR/AlgR family response regulator transcription factor n=1 Tax=Alistipes sp. TaxID=1872444 RepID=UPI0025C0FC94|nr:LytTR family DNA-binding domain-containing protein [Alistipes sp.]